MLPAVWCFLGEEAETILFFKLANLSSELLSKSDQMVEGLNLRGPQQREQHRRFLLPRVHSVVGGNNPSSQAGVVGMRGISPAFPVLTLRLQAPW